MKRVVYPVPSVEQQSQNHERHEAPSRHSPPSAAAAEPPSKERTQARQTQGLPSGFDGILVPSLKAGATAGACGLFAGAAAGIVRSAPTLFFSVIAGGQCFTLGTSYYATRLVGLRYFGTREFGESTPGDKVKASTVAGGVAGTLGGLLRGPRNILPGALMFSLFGAGGQAVVNWRAAKVANAPPTTGEGFWSRWSPVTKLSDEDYVKILEERLLRIEAEIALIDDHIKELRESKRQAAAENNISAPSDKA